MRRITGGWYVVDRRETSSTATCGARQDLIGVTIFLKKRVLDTLYVWLPTLTGIFHRYLRCMFRSCPTMEEYLAVFRLVIFSRYCSTKVTTLTVHFFYTDNFSITSPYVSINGKGILNSGNANAVQQNNTVSFNSGFLRPSLTSPFLMLPLLAPQTTSIHCHADASGQCKL